MRTNLSSEIIQLIAGHLRETNSPEQEKKFTEWLEVSGNDAEYNKYLKIWKEIAEASADSFDTERAWSELNRRLAEKRRRNFFSSRIVRVSAGIAAAAAVAFVSIFSYDIYESSGSKAVEFASVSGKSRVSLPDGSDVTLDTGASVSYEESFGKKTRNITADGRVFFDREGRRVNVAPETESAN